MSKTGNWFGANVIMKNGRGSELPLKAGGGAGFADVIMKQNAFEVSRVVMKGDREFGGVIFFDSNNKKILESGHTQTLESKEFAL